MTPKLKKPSTSVLQAAALLTAASLLIISSGCSWFGGGAEKERAKPAAAVEEPAPVTCPLCGMAVTGLPAIDRRPLAVKVENDPEARPQSGLDSPCVIYEEVTEGGITRFMPVYLCREAASIGPVRSARPADIELVFPYSAIFAHCGGGEPTLAMIKQSGIADLDQFAWPGAYWRTRDRRAPHNLYTSTEKLRASGEPAFPFHGDVSSPFLFMSDREQAKMESERGKEIERAAAQQSAPQPEYVPSMTVVSNIHIPYTPACAVRYGYDPSTGRFLRFVAGKPHVERTTGAQLAADNVIIQYVTETPSGIRDVRGADSPDLGVLGSGRAQVFVRGRLIDANWAKSTRADHTSYTDNSGKPVKLKPGVTWIQLVSAQKQATFD